jgi:hypothetical protein
MNTKRHEEKDNKFNHRGHGEHRGIKSEIITTGLTTD